jgi:hypothetical protein
MYPSRRVLAAVLIVCHGLTGCTSWRVQSVTPREFLATNHPDAVRVRDSSGATFVLRSPYVASDSLGGTRNGTPFMAPLDGIDRVAVRRFNLVKTAFWWVIVPVGALVALTGIVCATGGCDFSFNSWSY